LPLFATGGSNFCNFRWSQGCAPVDKIIHAFTLSIAPLEYGRTPHPDTITKRVICNHQRSSRMFKARARAIDSFALRIAYRECGLPGTSRQQYYVYMETLNERYCSLSSRRRYEVWFVRVGLVDGSGAWWFRYLLTNPGRRGCPNDPRGMPVQVWASFFPRDGKPQSFIQGFPLNDLDISAEGQNPFHFRIGPNEIGESLCRGNLQLEGHSLTWNLECLSNFRVTLSSKGWIGFSRTPHSDALYSGGITLDGRSFGGAPLGFGVQGHNCGYRHRNFWTWAHAYFPRAGSPPSTLEALVYEMPFGLIFRKAVLWHDGKKHKFKNLQEISRHQLEFCWRFYCSSSDGYRLQAVIDGTGLSIHRLPYLRTNCTGDFEVTNNSLARAVLRLEQRDRPIETLETGVGAVLEMVG